MATLRLTLDIEIEQYGVSDAVLKNRLLNLLHLAEDRGHFTGTTDAELAQFVASVVEISPGEFGNFPQDQAYRLVNQTADL